MVVIQGVEHRKRQLRFLYGITCPLLPDEIAKPEIEQVVGLDVLTWKNRSGLKKRSQVCEGIGEGIGCSYNMMADMVNLMRYRIFLYTFAMYAAP